MGPVKPPRTVLVVVTRRIGDVLLATPLIRSLKRAWPAAAMDVLVFAGTQGVLAANPDVRDVLTIAERPRMSEHLALATKIMRRYDVALSLVPSDRPTVYAWLAGRWRAGLVVDEPKHRWKRWLLQRSVPFDNIDTHTVLMHLALAVALGVESYHEVIASSNNADSAELARHLPFALSEPFVVLHAYPKFNYKMWRHAAWSELAGQLQARGLRVVLTGGSDSAELIYVGAIARELPGVVNLAGKLTLSQTACLLQYARGYVGSGHRRHAYGGGSRHTRGVSLRADQSCQVGTVAAWLCAGRQPVAAPRHAARQQRDTDAGNGDVRAVF